MTPIQYMTLIHRVKPSKILSYFSLLRVTQNENLATQFFIIITKLGNKNLK